MSFTPSIFPSESEADRRLRRASLEYTVQSLVGPIVDVDKLTDAELYGIRDRRLKPQPRKEPSCVY